MIIRQKVPKIKKQHIPHELFRVYKWIEVDPRDIPENSRYNGYINGRPKIYEGHFITRAYTKEKQFYECVTYHQPSIARLESSLRKWGNSRGHVANLDDEKMKLFNEGWRVFPQEKVGTKQKFKLVVEAPKEKEFNPRTDLVIAKPEKIQTLEELLAGQNSEYERALTFIRWDRERRKRK